MAAPLLVPLLTTVLIWVTRFLILRFIAALSLGVFTYRYVSSFFDEIRGYVQTGYSQLPAAALALLDIGGFTAGIEIMVSGMAFLAGFYAISWAVGLFGK